MRYKYRVTKYDPANRSADGAYRNDEWTSFSDIGRTFAGRLLSETEYLKTESAYLFSVESFLSEAKISSLHLRGLESAENPETPSHIFEDAQLGLLQCVEFAQLALRERIWGRLVWPGRAYLHFGYDFYMYFGLPSRCSRSIAEVQARGLFVETFRSPHLRP